MKRLNKKSLKQQGGQSTNKEQVDPIVQLANSFSEMASIGYEPKDIIIQFMDQAVPEDMIQATLTKIGYSNNDIQKLFSEINNPKVEKEKNAFNDIQAMLQQYDGEQDGLPQAKSGFRGTVNMQTGYNAPDSRYFPMDLYNEGNVLGALGDFYNTLAPHFQGPYSSNLFGNKVDPKTGFKRGLFKQMGKKKTARKLNEPYLKYTQDDYNIKEHPNDPNKGNYVYDLKDLHAASKGEGKRLSTKEQYKDRLKKHSQASWDPEAKRYYGRATAHPTNLDAFGPAHQEKLKKFFKQSRSFDEWETQTDPQTKAAIEEFQKNAPPGWSFKIDEDGRLHYVRPGADNPYEVDTMMGKNTGWFGPEDSWDPNMGALPGFPSRGDSSRYKQGGESYLPKAQRGMMERLGYRKNKDGTYAYSGSDQKIIEKVKLYNQGITGVKEPFTTYKKYMEDNPGTRVDTVYTNNNQIGTYNLTNPYSYTEGSGGKPTFLSGTSPITSGQTVSDFWQNALNRPYGERKHGGESHLPSYQTRGETQNIIEVASKNDPRYIAYKDSSDAYNLSVKRREIFEDKEYDGTNYGLQDLGNILSFNMFNNIKEEKAAKHKAYNEAYNAIYPDYPEPGRWNKKDNPRGWRTPNKPDRGSRYPHTNYGPDEDGWIDHGMGFMYKKPDTKVVINPNMKEPEKKEMV